MTQVVLHYAHTFEIFMFIIWIVLGLKLSFVYRKGPTVYTPDITSSRTSGNNTYVNTQTFGSGIL